MVILFIPLQFDISHFPIYRLRTIIVPNVTFTAVYTALESIQTSRVGGVKYDALVLEHMLVNRSIHTGRVALSTGPIWPNMFSNCSR